MEKVRIGIIGTGFTIGIAMSQINGYKKIEDAEVVAAYDIIPGRVEAFLERHKLEGIHPCTSLEELFSMVDAVSVCTPNYTHVDLAIKAMEAGKHVIVEKPFSLNYEDGMRALRAHEAHPDLVAMTVFNYREQKEVQMMKRIVDSGKLGKIISVRHIGGGGRMWDGEHVYLEWRMQEATSGTGAMADFGVHMLDLTDYLLHDQIGDYVKFDALTTTVVTERYPVDPTSVMGEKLGEQKRPVTNDDLAVFSAVTESGAMCTFQTGRLVNGINLFEIVGEQGVVCRCSAYPDGKLGLADRSKGNPKMPFMKMEVIDIDEDIMNSAEGMGMGHTGVLREFVNCIKMGKKPVRDFTHGIYVQKIIDNFAEAARTGRTVCEKVSEKDIR